LNYIHGYPYTINGKLYIYDSYKNKLIPNVRIYDHGKTYLFENQLFEYDLFKNTMYLKLFQPVYNLQLDFDRSKHEKEMKELTEKMLLKEDLADQRRIKAEKKHGESWLNKLWNNLVKIGKMIWTLFEFTNFIQGSGLFFWGK
jgi:hypothetical protein